MIRVTCLGHAALLAETEHARVLMDPILGTAVSGGGNVIDPPRSIDTTSLTQLDFVVLSHHHSDHYNLRDLELIPDAHSQHFVIPNDDQMESELSAWGVGTVTKLRPGESLQAGDLRLTATPSNVSFPEMGILFQQGKVRILNLVDTVFHTLMEKLLAIVGPAPNVVLAPFQAGGYMSFLPLREGALPPGLVPAIAAWSAEYAEEITHDLALLQPRLVASFADGLAYADDGINARHFPLPDADFIHRLSLLNIAACAAKPGLVLEAWEDKARMDGSALVEAAHSLAADRTFDPRLPLSCRPLSWYELPHGGLGRRIPEDWFCVLMEHLNTRLDQLGNHPDKEVMRSTLQNWHLELLHKGERLHLHCTWPVDSAQVWCQTNDRDPGRRYGVICHGPDLAQVACGALNLEAITLGGLFRYRSPEDDGELERLRHKVLNPMVWFFGE